MVSSSLVAPVEPVQTGDDIPQAA